MRLTGGCSIKYVFRAWDFLFRRQERHCDGYGSTKAQLKDNEQLIVYGTISHPQV